MRIIPLIIPLLALQACSKSEVDGSPPDTQTSQDSGDSSDDSGTEPDTLDMSKVQEKIASEMEDKFIPGLAAALIIGDEVVWAEGFGWASVEEETPVTPNTPFMLASISKTFTGTALMQAMEEGHFDLESPINDILSFPVDNPRVEGEVIQIKHLVTHTSGIRDNWSVWEEDNGDLYSDGDSPIPLSDFLQDYLLPTGAYYDAEKTFVDRAPGAQWNYGNVATALAGQLLEAGTGVPLDDHSDTAIFERLGMTHTGWHLEDHVVAEVAVPYTRSNGELVAVPHYGYPDYPDGQLRSSVADLGRYAAALLSQGSLDGEQLLTPESVDALFTPPLSAYEDQGVFWFRGEMRGHACWGHSGGDLGVQTDLKLFPESGFGIAILINTDQSVAWTGLMQIERELIKKAEDLLGL